MIIGDRYQRDYSVYRPAGYPVRHRRKVPFQPNVRLGLGYRRLLDRIRVIDAELERIILSDRDYLELVKDSFSSNIHRSVSLEGNPLTEKEVRRISTSFLEGRLNDLDTDNHTQEILNHLYFFLFKEKFSLPWNLETVEQVHSIITMGIGLGTKPGAFRKERSCVRGEDGFEYFIPCPPEHVEEEMVSLLDWLNHSPYDEVLTATIFFHEFESIHPFDDGNGRAGRTLFHMLLQEMGLKNSSLCKFEKEVLGSLDLYYGLLAYTDESGDYGPLILYVTESLLHAYEEALDSLQGKNVLKNLDETSKNLVIRAKGSSWFSVPDAAGWLGPMSEQTIRRRLVQLEDMGVIERKGRTRSLRFRFKDPFIDLREDRRKRFEQRRLLEE